MQRALTFKNIAIVFVKGSDYKIHFWCMSKNRATNLLRNTNLTEKKWNIIKHKNLLSHMKDE